MQSRHVSLTRTVSDLLKKEGVSAVYKGMSGPLITVPLVNSIVFTTYSIPKTYFEMQGKTGILYSK